MHASTVRVYLEVLRLLFSKSVINIIVCVDAVLA